MKKVIFKIFIAVTALLVSTSAFATSLFGEWIVQSACNHNINLRENAPYLQFCEADSRIYGSLGENIINANFLAGANKEIAVTEIAATKHYSNNIREENDIIEALDNARSYVITNGSNGISHLKLLDSRGHTVLTAKRHNADVISGVWKVSKIYSETPSIKGMELVIDIPMLQIHGKAACNIFNGKVGLDRKKDWFVQFHSITSTRARCNEVEEATERDLLVALEEVETIKRENDKNTVILLDKHGREVLTLNRIKTNHQ